MSVHFIFTISLRPLIIAPIDFRLFPTRPLRPSRCPYSPLFAFLLISAFFDTTPSEGLPLIFSPLPLLLADIFQFSSLFAPLCFFSFRLIN